MIYFTRFFGTNARKRFGRTFLMLTVMWSSAIFYDIADIEVVEAYKILKIIRYRTGVP